MSLSRLKNPSEFVRHVLVLITGTVAAQGISILFAPVMTRLFSPSEYGLLALFMSINTLLGVFATGQYALAIVQSQTKQEAADLLYLCFAISVALSLFALLVVSVLHGHLAIWLHSAALARWLFWLPTSILLGGFNATVQCWLNREKRFADMAFIQVVVSAATIVVQLAFGLVWRIQGGLIGAFMVALVINFGVMLWRFRTESGPRTPQATLSGIRLQAKRHFRFPAYSMPTELLNQTTNQVPVMVLNAFVGASSLGNYNLTQRILGMPSALVANAFTEVFRQRASADFAEQGNCVAIFRKTFKSLLLLSLPPFALLFAFAPPAFAFVFGERWREAGEYTRALSVMYWFGFFASPLSYVYFIAGKQGENLIMHFYMIASTVASIFVGFKLFGTSLGVIWCFSLNYAAIYAFCCLRSYTFAKGEPMSKARPPQGAELA